MNPTFVIAGTHEQAKDWITKDRNKHLENGTFRYTGDYVIVSNPTVLKGYSDPHGVFIGTWYERPDISEIFLLIRVASTISADNKGLLFAMETYDRYKSTKTI